VLSVGDGVADDVLELSQASAGGHGDHRLQK
jgi:hypothetical protein